MKLEDFLHQAHEDYLARVTAQAQFFFDTEFKEWCMRRRLLFSNGMGDYFFKTFKSDRMVDIEEHVAFAEMAKTLNTPVPGVNNCFGEFVPWVTRTHYHEEGIWE